MTALAIIEPNEPSLSELVARVSQEHALAQEALGTAVQHAINAGEALLSARVLVPRGEWKAWIAANFAMSYFTAARYMRFATYRDELAAEQPTSIDAARTLLEGLPSTRRGMWKNEAAIEVAKQLRGEGMSYAAIGAELGVSESGAHKYANYERAIALRRAAAKQRRLTAKDAAKQAERAQVDSALRKVGGGVSELYADIHKLTQKADKVIENASSKELRAGLNAALAKLHAARDEIVKAVGIA